MSITTKIDPSGFVSIQDDLWHIATSSMSGEINFKYVFDIHDASGNQLVRVKNYPDPSNGKGYFNAGNVVRNLIRYDWFEPERLVNSTNINGLRSIFNYVPNTSGEIAATYQIRYGEDYASGGVQITDLNLASSSIVAYNYLPKVFGRRKTSIADRSLKYLSNRPLRQRFDKTQDNHLFIPLMVDANSPSNFDVAIRTYNANNTQMGGETISNDIGTGKYFFQLDIGSKAINDTLNWFANDDPYFDYLNNVSYYVVDYLDYIFRVDLICSKNENISLHFINSYGMFDTAIFRGANKLNMAVDRKSFEKNDYKYTNTSVDYFNTDNLYYESKINYSQSINHTYKLTYENPDDHEYTWLGELMYSPLIYMEKDGNFYPVTIKNTTYQFNKTQYERLKNLEIEIEINQKRKGYSR